MNYEEVLAYYSGPQVKSEVSAYCRGKWVALEGLEQNGTRPFLRYWGRSKNPITIDSSEGLDGAFRRFRFFKPRTVYASINVYRKLENSEDTEAASNIAGSMPVWDVDANLDSWEYALKSASIIVSRLDKEGLNRSVYLKWSGRGIHIHVHEGAFSQGLLSRRNPLDIAFSVVEYVLRRTRDQLVPLAAKAPKSADRPLRVENKIDLKRVFTAPLSLHRQLDLCCVCFKPNDIHNFNLNWAKPGGYRHDSSWQICEKGEGDSLAEKALEEVGGYDGWHEAPKIGHEQTSSHVERIVTEAPAKEPSYRKLGRFQVMGLLQAARYYLVTGNLERAKSFGLNRAIFYAWAKRYTRDRLIQPRRRPEVLTTPAVDRGREQLGDEVAYISPRGWFAMGDAEQTVSDYDRQIAQRIETSAIPYDDAWVSAINYLKGFPKETLLNQQRFYREVYAPIRDSFHTLIKTKDEAEHQQSLDRILK